MEKIQRASLTFYRDEDWGGLRHGVFTRHGGVSESPWDTLNMGASIGDSAAAVKENHARMYRALDVCGERATSCWLIHGVDTLVVTAETLGNGPLLKADAMVTNQPDAPLVMRYADCVPLLFYDRARQAIGLGHAGWRGALAGIASRIVQVMRQTYGSRPADIEALVGPAISRRNYRVGEDVADQAQAYFGESAGVIWRDPADGKPHLDLWRANRLDLQRCGVTKIKVLPICTYENTKDFYSHRAEAGRTGRFGVLISL
ncbi:MAG: peptidoglycan editing factor PgeF [Chloroflexota bacterium]|nr:peptidoglycan editing factor PgeF [Chloroflexota bacterium]MDE2948299.1 peptidoglycan editing factor PgeF [Chloroflexota bacterium]